MASVLQRSVKLTASMAAVTRPVAAAVSVGVHQQQVVAARGFATAQKKKKSVSKKGSKKGSEDANFELMLRNIKGRYPEAYVHGVDLCIYRVYVCVVLTFLCLPACVYDIIK